MPNNIKIVVREFNPADREFNCEITDFINNCDQLSPDFLFEWNYVFTDLGLKVINIISLEFNEINGYLSFVIKTNSYGSIAYSYPYISYGGPLSKSLTVSKELIKQAVKFCKENGISLFNICSNPFSEWGLHSDFLEEDKHDYILKSKLQFSYLDSHPLKILSKKRRDSLKNEFSVIDKYPLSINSSLDLIEYVQWIEIYKKRYEELGINPFSKEFLLSFYNNILIKNKGKLYLLRCGEVMVGGIIILIGNKVIDYFISAFDSRHFNVNPTTVVLNQIFNEFSGKEFIYFNWQSSANNPGVIAYKSKWGAKFLEYSQIVKITGRVDGFLSRDLDNVRKDFEGFFILPFSLWNENGKSKLQ